jgi:rod shape determining protein RodA
MRDYRFLLVILATAVSIFGIVIIGSAASDESLQTKQMLGLILGLAVMAVVSLIDYNLILHFRWVIYLLNIALLVWVHFKGSESGGGVRWLELGSFRFQPSELTKVFMVLFFACYFSKYEDKINNWKTIVFGFILLFIPLVLVLKQPDLSTSIVIFMIFISLLFMAGLSYKIIGGGLAIGIPAFCVVFYMILQEGQNIIGDYQRNRIMAWLYPDQYPDLARQQQNSIIAIGSGKLFGKGLNNNEITSLKNGNYLSEPQTDFIFTVVGEELGFVGCVVLIILIFAIALECFIIAKQAKDLAGKLICVGVGSWIGFQGFFNVCVVSGLMPNTGLPLPFVSYGLTSLVTLFIGIGLVLNVGLQSRSTRKR